MRPGLYSWQDSPNAAGNAASSSSGFLVFVICLLEYNNLGICMLYGYARIASPCISLYSEQGLYSYPGVDETVIHRPVCRPPLANSKDRLKYPGVRS